MENNSLQIGMSGLVNNITEKNISIFDNDYLLSINELINNKKKNEVVCFTGNRPSSLPWRYNEDCELCKEFKSRLKEILKLLINNGSRKFICGMAMGFDIIAAEVVLSLKKDGEDVELECAVPCLDQTRNWKEDYKFRYENIINKADKVTFTSNYAYFDGCYAIRNQYMVDNASLVVGCQLKQSAGTKSTLNYARKNNKTLIILK